MPKKTQVAHYWLRVPGEEWEEVTVGQYIDAANKAGTLPLTHFVTDTLTGVVVCHEGPPRLRDFVSTIRSVS